MPIVYNNLYIFDIKNQASFTRWRGRSQTFDITEDGVNNQLYTATAIEVRVDILGDWEFSPVA